jgi:hypothetical protein
LASSSEPDFADSVAVTYLIAAMGVDPAQASEAVVEAEKFGTEFAVRGLRATEDDFFVCLFVCLMTRDECRVPSAD